ncbi:hypothetical protein [Kordiimonas lacus]|uniref:ABC-type amino acid transport substrate-binding protein n=1 Tax=Kordiimonas lacus TaxID=637679 RepID=A0A1G7EZV6_9PROT|nr:hypothetical protein [Kordiimonas lacus]SDE69107.1 hypothetical protein SAMN04488071_3554 [Kordiimonas lacus]
MTFRHTHIAAFLVCWLASIDPLQAETFRIEAPPPDGHFDYEVKLLQIALAHASGDHSLVLVEPDDERPANQGRMLRQFADGKSPYNILFSGYSPEREDMLEMVYIPLTRGLLGHRLLFIEEKTDSLLASIDTLAQFKSLVTLGMAISHPERPIYEYNGLQVTSAPSDSQWQLLARGRFHALLFGVDEAFPLLALKGGQHGNATITVSGQVRISYLYDSFFFVAKGDSKRAAIVTEGLLAAYDSGAFMAHFSNYPAIKQGLEIVAAHDRRVFWINNPYTSSRMRAIPGRFWHRFQNGGP